MRIAVVAHESRRMDATILAMEATADMVSFDDGTLGCAGNHQRAWQWHADMHTGDPTEWCVVLEDDALPVPDFPNQLAAALTMAPAPIVSLYLGTDGRDHWQSRIRAAIHITTPGTSWILSPSGALLHAVGVAIRADLLPVTLQPGLPPDAAISNWAKRHSHPIAYTWPSLIDHDDGPSVITRRGDPHPRDVARRAHHVSARPLWTRQAVVLN